MASHHFPHPPHHQPHPHHHHNPEYASPVLRAPSPASSVGTTYTPDQTSLSDSEQHLPQAAFERKWLAALDLDKPRKEELEADESPLIPRAGSKEEEQVMVEKILRSLRAKIQQLEEDEVFEQTLLRGSQVGLEAYSSMGDIDVLMRSMMGPSMSLGGQNNRISGRAAEEELTDGPWNHHNRSMVYYEGNSGVGTESMLASMTTSSTVGKRSRSGKTRKGK